MATFTVTYLLISRAEVDIDEKIEQICLEQSAELPRSVLSQEIIDEVVGTLVSRQQIADDRYKVTIAWPLAKKRYCSIFKSTVRQYFSAAGYPDYRH